MSALFLPALLLFFGILIPFGLVEIPDYSYLSSLIQPIIVRLVILAVFALSYFHWAHRFRFTLYEGLQLHSYSKIIVILCYGLAIVLTVISGYILLQL